MQKFEQSAVLGAGVIGSSWASLFLAAGQHVHVYEPTPDGEQKVRAYVENAWPTLERLGLTEKGDPDQITFHGTASSAVANVQFVQESVPEQLPIKNKLFAEIDPLTRHTSSHSSSWSPMTKLQKVS